MHFGDFAGVSGTSPTRKKKEGFDHVLAHVLAHDRLDHVLAQAWWPVASSPIENLTTLKTKAVEKKNASVNLFIKNSIENKSSKTRKVLSAKKGAPNAQR